MKHYKKKTRKKITRLERKNVRKKKIEKTRMVLEITQLLYLYY